MAAKKENDKRTEQEILNEVNRVPMTAESRAKMSLNIYDLQWLMRLQDVSNDAFRQEIVDDVAEKVSVKLAESLAPIYTRLEGLEQKLTERMNNLEQRVYISDEERLKKLEKYTSWKNTIIRKGIVIIIAVGLTLLVGSMMLKSRNNSLDTKLQNIEMMLQEHMDEEVK